MALAGDAVAKDFMVGDEVELFSHTADSWLRGRVTGPVQKDVTVASFQFSGMTWRKSFPLGSCTIRYVGNDVSRAPTSTAYGEEHDPKGIFERLGITKKKKMRKGLSYNPRPDKAKVIAVIADDYSCFAVDHVTPTVEMNFVRSLAADATETIMFLGVQQQVMPKQNSWSLQQEHMLMVTCTKCGSDDLILTTQQDISCCNCMALHRNPKNEDSHGRKNLEEKHLEVCQALRHIAKKEGWKLNDTMLDQVLKPEEIKQFHEEKDLEKGINYRCHGCLETSVLPRMLGNVFGHLTEPTDVYYFSPRRYRLQMSDECVIPDHINFHTLLLGDGVGGKVHDKLDQLTPHQPNERHWEK